MRMTMLGTGNANVTECYNTCFVLEDDAAGREASDSRVASDARGGEECRGTEHSCAAEPEHIPESRKKGQEERYFLVDAGGGNGILSQLAHAGIDRYEIRSMFISHRHTDHIMGGVWMMRNVLHGLKYGDFEGEASIYGNTEVIRILRGMAELLFTPRDLAFIGPNLHLIEVADGDVHEILGRRVMFFDTGSTKSAMSGFRMELDRAGDGHAEPDARRVLVFCGDEPVRESTRRYAADAQWALFEAFCLYEDAGRFRPYEKGHSTVKNACELAQELGVRNLVLYHTEDTDLPLRRKRYTAEGQRYYHGNLYVPDDLDVIELG